jgi:hypothetical protein
LVSVGIATVIWSLWKTGNAGNAVCFDNIFPYDPTSVIAQTAHWLNSIFFNNTFFL